MITEKSRKSVMEIIHMDWRGIERDVGKGTCEKLIKLFDEYFSAIEEHDKLDTDKSKWKSDLAKNNLYEELYKGLRLTS